MAVLPKVLCAVGVPAESGLIDGTFDWVVLAVPAPQAEALLILPAGDSVSIKSRGEPPFPVCSL